MNLTHHAATVLTLPAEKPGEMCPEAPTAMADAVINVESFRV
jgi:hypothetical protein